MKYCIFPSNENKLFPPKVYPGIKLDVALSYNQILNLFGAVTLKQIRRQTQKVAAVLRNMKAPMFAFSLRSSSNTVIRDVDLLKITKVSSKSDIAM